MNRYDLDIEPTITQRPMYHGVVKKTISYENNTGVPVHVTELSGGSFILAPSSHTASEFGIVVYVTYKAVGGQANLTGLREGFPAKQFSQMCREIQECGETTLMYVVSDISALMHGDLVVLKKLGMAFSTQPVRLDSNPIALPGGERSEFTLGVVVVQRYDDPKVYRWVRFYTTQVEVDPIRSKYYDEGIYMVIGGGKLVEGGRMLHFTFDDPLSPFRVFATEDESRSYRWMDAIPDLRDIRSKLEANYQSKLQDLDDRKNQLDLEYRTQSNELAIEKERLSLQNKREENEIKQRAEVRKDQYEARSIHRKDGSEFLKAIPAFMAAGVAVIGMLM